MDHKKRSRKNVVKGAAVILIIAAVLLTLSPAAAASGEDAQFCIAQMIRYYEVYQDAAATDIMRLNAALAGIDAGQAAVWGEIMSYWSWVNREMEINTGVLPDGLPNDGSLCIVVLGYALNDDGTMKDELFGRLDTALASARKYPNAYIACTGGGTAKDAPGVTEAEQMAAWLMEQGVAQDRIIVENTSLNTVQNAQFTYEILRERYGQVTDVALISSDYHLPRGCILYRSQILLSAHAANDHPLNIVGSAGFAAGHAGYEDVALQARGMAQLAGAALQDEEAPALSVLTALTMEGGGEYAYGDEPVFTVTAHYDSGFARDVTGLCRISGYDPEDAGEQLVAAFYAENGVEKTAQCRITRKAVMTAQEQATPDAAPDWPPYAAALAVLLLALPAATLKKAGIGGR